MEPFVKTRWTHEGLIEVTLDADTAQAVLVDLGRQSGAKTAKLYEALGHTLNTERKT